MAPGKQNVRATSPKENMECQFFGIEFDSLRDTYLI